MSDGFKHITVSPEPEEDVVIHAGLRPADEQVRTEVESGSSLTASDEEQAIEPPPSAEGGAADQADGSSRVEGSSDTEDRSVRSSDRSADSAVSLDELDVGPMPLVQRIVIGAVVVCLIGAIVYYFMFMG